MISSKKIFHANNLEIFDTRFKETYPYIVRKTQNNGIRGYIKESEEFLNRGNTLSFAQDTFTVFYQKERYFTGNNVKVLKPKVKKFNQEIAKFVVAIFQFTLRNFTWGTGSNVNMINSINIQLPTKNGEIDFEFMESFVAELEAQHVAELEAQHVAELEAYLLATGLKDYELTDKEKQAIDDYKNGRINLIELKISDIFNVSSSKKKFDANKVQILSNGYPYVVRTSKNNGIRGYLNEDINYLNDGNTISFGQDTATMFYQENPYFTGDKIKILKSKFKEFNKCSAQYFISAMAKTFSAFAWGASSFSESVIKEQEIFVKIQDNKIDFEFMEILISAVQKLVIKDVVLYADRKIEATKQVID